MDIVWIVLKFIIANILLIIISSTLIGFIVRGLLQPRVTNSYTEHKAEWYTISRTRGIVYSVSSICATILILFLLFRYTNIYIIIGFLVLMLPRIKDLLKEIETGIKTAKKNMTIDKIDFVLNIISFIGIGIFNYKLYLLWIK